MTPLISNSTISVDPSLTSLGRGLHAFTELGHFSSVTFADNNTSLCNEQSTINVMFKPNNQDMQGELFRITSLGDNNLIFSISLSRFIVTLRVREQASAFLYNAMATPVEDRWYMLMVSINGTEISAFLDKVLMTSITVSKPLSLVHDGGSTVTIGRFVANSLTSIVYAPSTRVVLGKAEVEDLAPLDILALGEYHGYMRAHNVGGVTFFGNEEQYITFLNPPLVSRILTFFIDGMSSLEDK